MGQALGSTASHERMNSLMDQMMGSGAVDSDAHLPRRALSRQECEDLGSIPSMYGSIGMIAPARVIT
jgi:hypothetical protein